jgi:carbon monoxide dehydrogenase subunit G
MIVNESLTIKGEGKGGPAGYAKGGANVRLEPNGDTTTLHYDVEANVGGKMAQLGSRIIDGFAKKMADQFFANFQDAVEPPDPETDAGEDEIKKKGWFRSLTGS